MTAPPPAAKPRIFTPAPQPAPATAPKPAAEPPAAARCRRRRSPSPRRRRPPRRRRTSRRPTRRRRRWAPAAAEEASPQPGLLRRTFSFGRSKKEPKAETPAPAAGAAETPAKETPPSRGSLMGSMMGSVSSLFKRDTQLEDQVQFVYNEKYKSYIPSNEDPDEWAKANMPSAAPPPKSNASTPAGAGAASATATPAASPAAAPGTGGTPTAGTPAAATPTSAPGSDGLSLGPAPMRGRPSSKRSAPRSRYVETGGWRDPNAPPDTAPKKSDAELMPPPASRPKPKIFTPQRAAAEPAADGADGADGAELPAFMTPQADLLKNMKSFGGEDEGAAKAAE